MKQDARNIIAVALSTAVLVVWFLFFSQPPSPEEGQQPPPPVTTTPLSPSSSETSAQHASPSGDSQANLPLQESILETDLAEIVMTNDGGLLRSWKLKGYETATDQKKMAVDMMSSLPDAKGNLHFTFADANFFFPEIPRYRLVEKRGTTLSYEWRSPEVVVIKTITLHADNYLADVIVEVTNTTSHALTFRPLLKLSGLFLPDTQGGFWKFLKPPALANKQPAFYLNGKVERFPAIAGLPATTTHTGSLYWAGLEDRYFLGALIPRAQGGDLEVLVETADIPALGAGTRELRTGIALATVTLAPGEKTSQGFLVYAGPKEITALKKVGVQLDTAIDYGWFSFVAVPILHLLKFFYRVVQNYGLAIIVLTIFIKLLLHPITRKSMQSMKGMQKVQPELKEIQKKYRNDKNRLNQETMLLFKRHSVNPLGGCLPMLLQFPIYIALYKVLWSSIELYRAPFFWFYHDLSAPDPYLITPILLGISMVAQQKMMPSTSMDPVQQKMMMVMPVMFSAFMIFLPVGLTVYILVNTALTVLQQWMANNDIRLRDIIRGRL